MAEENPPEEANVEEPQSRMARIASSIAKGIDSLDRVAEAFRTVTPEEREEVMRTFVSGDIEDVVAETVVDSPSMGESEVGEGRIDLEVSDTFLANLQGSVVLRGRIAERTAHLGNEKRKTENELVVLRRKRKLLLGLNHKRMVVRFIARVKLSRQGNQDIASEVKELNTVRIISGLSNWEKIRKRFGNRIAKKRDKVLDIAKGLEAAITEKEGKIAGITKELVQRGQESSKLSREEVRHLGIYRAALSGGNPTLSSGALGSTLSSAAQEGLPDPGVELADRYELLKAIDFWVELSRVREGLRGLLTQDLVKVSREEARSHYDLDRLEIVSKLRRGGQISIAREKLEEISKEEIKRAAKEIKNIKGDIVSLEKEIKLLEKQKSNLGKDNIVRRGIRKVAVTLSKTARDKRPKKMLK